jgi:hypothetical protein
MGPVAAPTGPQADGAVRSASPVACTKALRTTKDELGYRLAHMTS